MTSESDTELMTRRIREAFDAGRVMECAGSPAERRVEAEWFVRAILMGMQPEGRANMRCQIQGAVFVGNFDLSGWQTDMSLIFKDCTFEEAPNFTDCSLAVLRLPGCISPGLEAAGLRTRGDLELSTNFRSTGLTNLLGARIEGSLSLRGASLKNPNEVALQASHVRVGGQFKGSKLEVEGTIRVLGMRVDGMFSLWDSHLKAPANGISLNGERLEVGETLFMKGDFSTEGEISLSYAKIGGGLDMRSASLGKGTLTGNSLSANRIVVGRNISMIKNFTADGTVSLEKATVGGDITVTDSFLRGVPVALSINNAVSDRLVLRLPGVPDGEFLLQDASVGTLVDETPKAWPSNYELEGFTFRRIGRRSQPQSTVKSIVATSELLEWVEKAKGGYLPGIYDVIDAALRSSGEEDAALLVRYEKQRAKTRSSSGALKAWGGFLDLTLGYGFKGVRACLWLVALAAVAGLFFTLPPFSLHAVTGKECYYIAYAADLLLPIIDLGQAEVCIARGPGIWLGWGLTAAGWALTAAVVAATGRMFRRGD